MIHNLKFLITIFNFNEKPLHYIIWYAYKGLCISNVVN